MNNRRLPLTNFLIGLAAASLILSSCSASPKDHPAAALQKEIASLLASPDSCSAGTSADIQQLIDNSPDGIIRLPEGCYLISSTIDLPPGVRLVGAGVEKTILYRDPEMTFSNPILSVRGGIVNPGVTQISGLALIGVRNSDDLGQDYGLTLTNLADFRVDHCYFEGFGFAAVRVNGDSKGVVDHSIFVDNFKRAIDNLGYGVVVYGSGAWEADPQPGSDQATFVEDSLFVGQRHAIAANAGAHYVFRYNQVLHNVVACAVDAHGMGYGSSHGTRYVEIYRNILSDPVENWCGIGIRGGAGVIFENTIKGYQNPILLILEWGTPDNLKARYPAFEQIQDLYIWDNQIKNGPSEPQVDETGVGFIETGRDYYLQPKPGYTPYFYPHQLANGGELDKIPWPPMIK